MITICAVLVYCVAVSVEAEQSICCMPTQLPVVVISH